MFTQEYLFDLAIEIIYEDLFVAFITYICSKSLVTFRAAIHIDDPRPSAS